MENHIDVIVHARETVWYGSNLDFFLKC